MDDTGQLKNEADASDKATAFASILHATGRKTRFVCESESFDDVWVQALVDVALPGHCSAWIWVRITKENLWPIISGEYEHPRPEQFHLCSGDIVRAVDGRRADVEMIYYDRFHTGSSPDLVRLTFSDGSTRQALTTSDYILEKLQTKADISKGKGE